MNEKRPLIITFIGYTYVLGALVSILSLFPKFLERFGVYVVQLPIPSESIMIPIILLISYGYLRLKRWGYWLMVIYNIFFLVVCIIIYQQSEQLFPFQKAMVTFIALVFILSTKKYFGKNIFSS
jgi:peptidoglycan/LPS O-acetylase OafA/YrhL